MLLANAKNEYSFVEIEDIEARIEYYKKLLESLDMPGLKKKRDDLIALIEREKAELEEIVLSYAITIHKSQGSEFPGVIIPIMGGSPLLMNKNLLYTAVTRAKKMVILIGKSTNIYYMVMNKSSAIRHTMLRSLLDKNEGLFKDLDIQVEE